MEQSLKEWIILKLYRILILSFFLWFRFKILSNVEMKSIKISNESVNSI